MNKITNIQQRMLITKTHKDNRIVIARFHGQVTEPCHQAELEYNRFTHASDTINLFSTVNTLIHVDDPAAQGLLFALSYNEITDAKPDNAFIVIDIYSDKQNTIKYASSDAQEKLRITAINWVTAFVRALEEHDRQMTDNKLLNDEFGKDYPVATSNGLIEGYKEGLLNKK